MPMPYPAERVAAARAPLELNRDLTKDKGALVLGERVAEGGSVMMFATILVAAAAAAAPQWVPLNSPQAKQEQGRAKPAQRAAAAAPSVPAPASSAADIVPPAAAPHSPVAAAPVTDGSRPLQLTCLGAG